MEVKRNIINLKEVNSLIEELSAQFPSLRPYISAKVYKYLKYDSYLVQRKLYGLFLKVKIATGLSSSLEKKIYKNYGLWGKYHTVPCSSRLLTRISQGLEFLIKNNLPTTMSFKEVLLEADNYKKQVPAANKIILVPGIDYLIRSYFFDFEVWELKSLNAYIQEGQLMKNCLGKTDLPNKKNCILSIRHVETKLPVLSIKVSRKDNMIIEAKEKVNRKINQFNPVFEKTAELLHLKNKTT